MSDFGDGGLTEWLRRMIESDLTRWRDREAHFLRVREREGDYDYFEARERVVQLEVQLAVIALHRHVPSRTGLYGTPFDFGCENCHEIDDGEGLSDVRADGWCETVLQLAYGYRFRPGYRRAAWKPVLTPKQWIKGRRERETRQ